MDELTLEQLKDMPYGVFASGITTNSPDGVYMTDSRYGDPLAWVAKRGGNNDWAIYCAWLEDGGNYAATNGQKVGNERNIRKLVPCTDEAFKMYRE